MAKPKFIYVKGVSGLGNRLLAVLSAIVYARLSDRVLLVEWNDPMYSNDGSNIFGHLFSRPRNSDDLTLNSAATVAPAVWRGRLDWTVGRVLVAEGVLHGTARWSEFAATPSLLRGNEEVLVFWSTKEMVRELRPYFRPADRSLSDLDDEGILRMLIHDELELDSELERRVSSFREQHWDDEIVGLHVRYSDLRCRLSALLKQADRLMAMGPKRKIFLATDNRGLVQQVRERYGSARVLTTPKWYAEAGVALHKSPACPDRLESAREALVDLYLLGSAHWLITDERSTFGYVARLLFRGPADRVRNVDPGRFLPRHVGHRLGRWRIVAKEHWHQLRTPRRAE